MLSHTFLLLTWVISLSWKTPLSLIRLASFYLFSKAGLKPHLSEALLNSSRETGDAYSNLYMNLLHATCLHAFLTLDYGLLGQDVFIIHLCVTISYNNAGNMVDSLRMLE